MKRIGVIAGGVVCTATLDVLGMHVPLSAGPRGITLYVVARVVIAAGVGAFLAQLGTLPRALIGAIAVSLLPPCLISVLLILTGHALATGPAIVASFLIFAGVVGLLGGVLGAGLSRLGWVKPPAV